jgi:signal transduction histidine kinase
MGRIVYSHRQHASSQQDRAEMLERDQKARAARAVATERARIARELHDVIAHSLSVIVVQAAAERRVLSAGQESTAETLESIEQSGRQAMTELRRLLGLLRKSDGEPSLAPQPGLSRLGDLVAEVREAGVEVDVRMDGDLAAIPPGCGPVGVPHRPGMPDGRAQARPCAPGRGIAALPGPVRRNRRHRRRGRCRTVWGARSLPAL